MARAAPRSTATIMEYHNIRHTDKCPPDLAERTPVRPMSLCLAADIFASFFQEKDDNGCMNALLAMEKRLLAASEDGVGPIHKLIILLITINAVACPGRKKDRRKVFSLLEFDSPDYRKLFERFNTVKLKLRSREEARLHERAALLLTQDGHSVRLRS